jgi:hypothetical protein
MTPLLLVVLAAIALGIGSAATLALFVYRLHAASLEVEPHMKTGQYARVILIAIAGLLASGLTLFWSYGQFIALKGR